MKFHSESLVIKVRQLKKEGVSAAEIAKRFHIGDATVLRWCNDIPSQDPYHTRSKKLRDKARDKNKHLAKEMKLTESHAKILASVLYWCEGAKYPSTNFVSFVNSDIELMVTFLKLFRKGFKPKEDKLKAYLQLHDTHDIQKMTSFWSTTLRIPKSQFYKPTITKPTKRMKRTGYKGTCAVRYYDVYLLLEIVGIYEGFSKLVRKKT